LNIRPESGIRLTKQANGEITDEKEMALNVGGPATPFYSYFFFFTDSKL
jgi:hypothetical protein